MGRAVSWVPHPPASLSVGGAEKSTHIQAHRDTQIKASLWDRENAKATVNVKTCPASKTHGSPFTPPIGDKGALYFSSYKPLDETSGSQRHRQSEEAPPEHWSHCLPMSLAHFLFLSHSQQRFIRSTEGTDTDKTNYLQHAPVAQTCLILSGWHSKIRRDSLNINLSFQRSLQRQTKPQSK